MNPIIKVTAWICIVSTGLLGCTNSELVIPGGENAEKLYSGEIESVITKDGTTYVFESNMSPKIVAGSIRGLSAGKAVSISLTDVAKVYVRESNAGLTLLFIGGVVVAALLGVFLVFVLSGGIRG